MPSSVGGCRSRRLAIGFLSLGFFVLLVPSCARPLRVVPGKQEAIKQAYALLHRPGFDEGLSYDHASYLPVRFRDGDEGVFIAIGFCCFVRGYSMVFSVRNGSLEPLYVRRDKVDWGIWSTGIWGQRDKREVDAELVQLVLDRRRGPEEVVKVTGCQYGHVSADMDGYFELLRVSSRRVERLFAGAAADEFIRSESGAVSWLEHQYQYVNRDGTDEIHESVSACRHAPGADMSTKECRPDDERIYRFDGSAFVPVQ